jgi:hypothetical protein
MREQTGQAGVSIFYKWARGAKGSIGEGLTVKYLILNHVAKLLFGQNGRSELFLKKESFAM